MFDSTKFDNNFQILSTNGFVNLHSEGFVAPDWKLSAGPLPFSMTNDFLFRAIPQHNADVLKSYISAGMHIDAALIKTVMIKNPILPSDRIDGKEFIMDILVVLNDDAIVNLEMQVVNYGDWPERSLSYLCREFCDLNRGDFYKNTKSAVHIGFLDFPLYEEKNTLWSSYRITDTISHRVFTDKFQLYIISLPMKDAADKTDKRFHTDIWAKFFKAKTYEELKMLAVQDENINIAAQNAFSLWSDERTRRMLQSREEFILMQQTQQKERDDLEKQVMFLRQQADEAKSRADAEKNRADTEKNRADDLTLTIINLAERYARAHDISVKDACQELSLDYTAYQGAKAKL